MSKAMDALKALEDRIIPFRLIEKGSPGADAISALRDYITTTEAREAEWSNALADEQLAHETDLTQSAARIKELEAKGEELAVTAGNLMMERDALKKLLKDVLEHINPQGHATLWQQIEAAIYGPYKAALDGARKVGA